MTVTLAPDWFVNAFAMVEPPDDSDQDADENEAYPLGFV
jgi:hypothetical protein